MNYTEQVRQENAAREATCSLLNGRGIRPIVDGNWYFDDIEDGSDAVLGWEAVELTDIELAELELKPDDVRVEEHPEGEDRGGYVVYAGLAFFDIHGGDWV